MKQKLEYLAQGEYTMSSEGSPVETGDYRLCYSRFILVSHVTRVSHHDQSRRIPQPPEFVPEPLAE